MRPSPGTRFGPYEVRAALGAGGMGEVYRAHDTRLSRDVALKVIPAAFAADHERLARFRREAQTLAALNHPNVAAIYGLDEVGGTPYLVLELVDGETLAARLRRGVLAPREAVSFGVQIAVAIEAAHERGIVHRDLKPGNIMITGTNVVKVLDFGLARFDATLAPGDGHGDLRTVTGNDGATLEGAILGTIAYMSPEQARGRPVDRRSDIWSFGCVLFECLAGVPPFAGETASDVIARILEREPDWAKLPSGTPARVREVLRRCLKKDADARPRDIRDVRLELTDSAPGAAPGRGSGDQSVAVLPFDNLSGPDDEYFADGVTEEVLNRLTHLEGLRVAARTSCFAFKGRREDLRAIGEQLDVASVLEGSVRRAGSRLRITAQLVNVANGYQLWSERYDREMTDVFDVQDEIANSIATRLRGSLQAEAERGRSRQGTKSLEAYELLLKGRAHQNRRGRFLLQAIACFEQAIELDPEYAEAMAWLSDSYRLMATFGDAPYSEAMPRAKTLAERSLAIDPDLAEALVTLAAVAEQYEWDFDGARPLWDRALAAEPRHARGRAQRALWWFMIGSFTADEALAETARAVEDDPLNAWVGAMNSHMLGLAERHVESIVEAEHSLQMDDESFFAQWNLLRSYAWGGQFERAIELAPAALRMSGRHPWALGALAWTYGKAGRADAARAVYDEMEARSRLQFMSAFWLAVAAGSAGLKDQANQLIDRAVAEHDPLLLWVHASQYADAIRELPKFGELRRRVWSVRWAPQ